MARRSPTGGSARDGCYAGCVSFRPAADSDRAVVEAIWQEQNRLHAGLEPTIVATADPVMSEERFREILDDPLQEIAVAVEGEAVVGAALLIERHLQGELQVPRSVAFVQEICILEPERRRGGRATTNAVVSASILILASNYLLTEALFPG